MLRPIKLSVIRNERREKDAKEIRSDMYGRLRLCVQGAGDDLAGYALVLWDKDGNNWSVIKPGGPIKSRMAPEFARDSLSQHATLLIEGNPVE